MAKVGVGCRRSVRLVSLHGEPPSLYLRLLKISSSFLHNRAVYFYTSLLLSLPTQVSVLDILSSLVKHWSMQDFITGRTLSLLGGTTTYLERILPFICMLSVVKPSRLAFSSSVGNVSVFTCIIVVMYFSASHLSVDNIDPDWSFVHPSTLPIFFGIRYVTFARYFFGMAL